MKSDTRALLTQLRDALLKLELRQEAEKVERWSEQMESESGLERAAAVRQVERHCHVKAWGDLNLDVPGTGSYPVFQFLDRVRKAVKAEV